MEKGLLGALQQYINDALPGGSLNREVSPDKAKGVLSLLADLTPVVGGVKGALEEYNQGNPGWAAVNAATVPLDIATAGGGTLAKSLLAKGLPAALGMTAWHGSPHTFSKFLLDKIGTGEGAQSFGHGTYLAENPDVARAYRSNLVKEPTFIEQKTGKKITKNDPTYDDLVERQSRMERNGYGAEFDKKYRIEEGALYKTDIPDEAVPRMLDWDKPLGQQPSHVQDALRNSSIGSRPDLMERTGNELHDLLMFDIQDKIAKETGKLRNGSQQDKVAEHLQTLGIPGIKYLDQGSRGIGQGTRNFVVFDPEMIRIIERNNEATGTLPWKPKEWGK